MRRTVLFLLLTVVMLPVIGQDFIGQEVTFSRNCRPRLDRIDLFRHTQRRVSATNITEGDTIGNPLIGERHQLVVLAAFADKGFRGDSLQTIRHWNNTLNTKNLSDNQLYGSLHDYFYDQSYGQLDLSFDLFYAQVDSMKKYRSTQYDDENSKYLVQDIVEIIKDSINDWGQYDWDNDGKVDQLLILYAGKGMNDGGGNMSIWPHQWWMSEHDSCESIPVTTGFKTYLIDAYCAVQELSGKGDYGTFGTLCHEYSHCFGLPDLYDGSMSYLGSWDLMDEGNFNGSGFHPCGYSAFERTYLGWLNPVELNNDTVVDGMKALSDASVSYLIRNDGWADEYYLVENRQMKGWDESLPGSGIVVCHVDYDDYIFHNGSVNNKNRQLYTIIPANGLTYTSKANMKYWAYPYADNDSLTNTSAPAAELNKSNRDGSLLMSKPLTEMTVVNGLASFRFANLLKDYTLVPPIRLEGKGEWFTIDGRLLPGKPVVHGLYIHEGRVVLVK